MRNEKPFSFSKQKVNGEDKKEMKEEDIKELEEMVKNNKRSKLHNIDTLRWLKARAKCKKEIKRNYLLYPEEMEQEMRIKKIFMTFDEDKSNALDLGEMVEMFQNFKIDVDRNKLEQMYKVIDGNQDGALNFKEFQNCALSQEANIIFSDVIKDVERKESLFKDESERSVYLPRTFSAMVTYLSYLMTRDQKKEMIENKNNKVSTVDRMQQFLQLIGMNDLQANSLVGEKLAKQAVQQQNEKFQESQQQEDKIKGLKFIKLVQNPVLQDNVENESSFSEQEEAKEVQKETKQEVKYVVKKAKSEGKIAAWNLYSRIEEIQNLQQQADLQSGVLQSDKQFMSQTQNNNMDQQNVQKKQQSYFTQKQFYNPAELNYAQTSKSGAEQNKTSNMFKSQASLLQTNFILSKNKGQLKHSQTFKELSNVMQDHIKTIEQNKLLDIKLDNQNKINKLKLLKQIEKNSMGSGFTIGTDLISEEKEKEKEKVKQLKNDLFETYKFNKQDNRTKNASQPQNQNKRNQQQQQEQQQQQQSFRKTGYYPNTKHKIFSEMTLLSNQTPRNGIQTQQLPRIQASSQNKLTQQQFYQ